MFGSFRVRLIATVIVLVAVTAGLVAVTSFVLVRNSLRSQLVDDSVARAEFNITVLASLDQLSPDADLEEFEASGLVDRFLLRGTGGVYVEFPDGDPFASSLGLLAADELLSGEIREIVDRNEYGYEFLTIDGNPTLAVGGRRQPTGPDFYFFYSAEDTDSALSQLGRVLALAGIGMLVLGALGAGMISSRVLRPVAVAGRAAGRMAEGDLSVRVPAETSDELGQMAIAFNQMAAALELQIGALLEAHDRERRFVADVSHELRTPITALVNEAAMLERRLDELPATDRRVGEMLVTDVGRLRTLIEDLLEISRLDAGSATPDASDVDLPRFLGAVIADRHPAATLLISDSMASVRTDRRSLERIVGNLLDNARRHAPDAAATVTAVVEVDMLHIDVADDGPGVAPDELPNLFDRFYKADSSRQGGSGLGLAIARQHARQLGGDLTAQPGAHAGMVFELRLPVTHSLHASDGAEIPESDPEGEEESPPRRKS
jgi:two-component system sensor histidine kinase MtrB